MADAALMLRLVARDLACVRGGRAVWSRLGFTLEAGGALLVVGPNGAGKSSLLRLIAGLLRPNSGKLALEGGDSERTLAEQCHYLGHQDALKPALSVRENLTFWSDVLGGTRADCASALATLGLGSIADLPAGYLSAGQRRRLSLARLVAVNRPLWLLDEPTSALDAAGQDLLARLMRAHRDAGGLVVAATHSPIGLTGAAQLELGRSP
jgi:heme exporter protein A